MRPGLFGVGEATAASALFTASARKRTSGLFMESLEVFSVCLVSSWTAMAFAAAASLIRRPGSSEVSSAASVFSADVRWTMPRLPSTGAAQVMWLRTSRVLRKYGTASMVLGICICEPWPKLCFVNALYLNLGRFEAKRRDSQLESTKTNECGVRRIYICTGRIWGAECRQASNYPEVSIVGALLGIPAVQTHQSVKGRKTIVGCCQQISMH